MKFEDFFNMQKRIASRVIQIENVEELKKFIEDLLRNAEVEFDPDTLLFLENAKIAFTVTGAFIIEGATIGATLGGPKGAVIGGSIGAIVGSSISFLIIKKRIRLRILPSPNGQFFAELTPLTTFD